jgi:hypothetical protein
MFADAPHQYCDYVVHTPDGRELTDATDRKTLTQLGLQRNYWGNPLGVGVGFEPAPTVDHFGEVASEREVRDMVAERLKQFPAWPLVVVEQRIVGPADAERIGVVRYTHWRVDNPYFREPGLP